MHNKSIYGFDLKKHYATLSGLDMELKPNQASLVFTENKDGSIDVEIFGPNGTAKDFAKDIQISIATGDVLLGMALMDEDDMMEN